MEIRSMNLKEINPAKYNPRKRMIKKSFEYKALEKSLDEFGLVVPLIVNTRTNTLISGHQRYWVLLDHGQETADCVAVDFDEAKEKALCIAMNKVDGTWDYAMLADLLEELSNTEIDMDITGFSADQINDILNDIDAGFESTDSGVENKAKRDDGKEGVKCLVGEYAFYIPDNMFEQAIAEIRLKVGYTKEKVIEELQRRLYRDQA